VAAHRSTQQTVEFLYLPPPVNLRSTQQTVEYIYLPPPVSLRSTQQTVEVLYLPVSPFAFVEREVPRGVERGVWRQ
jgi:hypothetical protein